MSSLFPIAAEFCFFGQILLPFQKAQGSILSQDHYEDRVALNVVVPSTDCECAFGAADEAAKGAPRKGRGKPAGLLGGQEGAFGFDENPAGPKGAGKGS
ncbi:hypothetical protein EB061_04715 [bacterium]|nr:hypothetical protein [bacterium]